MTKRPLVFDSWAILAFLEGEPEADKVEALILRGDESKSPMWITTVNLGEVWYSIARKRSAPEADKKVDEILRLGFEVVDVNWALARQAARFKSEHKLACGDCFAAALAKERKAEVVTGDLEFQQLEKETRVLWLRRPV